MTNFNDWHYVTIIGMDLYLGKVLSIDEKKGTAEVFFPVSPYKVNGKRENVTLNLPLNKLKCFV